MSKVIMIGCDLHDAWMRLKVAVGPGKAVAKTFATADVLAMIAWVKEFAAQHGVARIVFAYEASGQGFGLYDALTEAGIECYVLAPTHLPHTAHGRKNKTDDKDALMILDEVRAHVLAGRKLPAVWIPDRQTRDDREAVRMRLEVGEQRTRIKNQIRNLAKRSKLTLPAWFTKSGNWSRRSLRWLRSVAAEEVEQQVGQGIRVTLNALIDIYEELSRQLGVLDQAVAKLACTPRYARAFAKLKLLPGVGTLTAMVFLTELGDLARFANRRQLAAYLGLAPAAYESGERDDRKGHITRQGPSRVRHLLCQAAWAAQRVCSTWKARYEQLKRGSQKRSKIAIVALMRQLAIQMWHTARSQELEKLFEVAGPPEGKTSARARQKGPPHPPYAITSACSG
jgi:transposase